MTALVTENLALLAGAPDGLERLRSLIAELAVRGLLVPQDSADEPASKLAARLVAAKAQAVLDGARKQKALEPLAAAGRRFETPASWTWELLDSLLQIAGGVTLGRKLEGRSMVARPYLRVANVQRGFVSLGDLKEVEIPEDELAKYELRSGDLLITEGGDWDKVGRTAIWRGDIASCLHQNHVFRARACGDDFNPRWAELYLNSAQARSYFAGSSKQTTNLASINMTQLRSCALPLPPLAEQHRIVAKVDELMALCDRLEARQQDAEAAHAQLVQALLDSLTQARDADEFQDSWQRLALCFDSIFSDSESVEALEAAVFDLAARGVLTRRESGDEPAALLLSGIAEHKAALARSGLMRGAKSRPPVVGPIPFDLPNTWRWARWDDVATKIGDIDHKMPEPDPNGVPFVSPRDFYPGNVIDFEGAKRVARADYERLSSKIRAERGDLIYPRYGTIGESVLVTVDREFLVSYSCAVIKVARGFIEPRYQFYVSLSGCIRRQAKAAENKTTQANVGIKSIQEFMFPVPPLAEQRRIVAKVTELLALCDQLKARIAAARAKHAQLAEALVAQAVA